MANFYKIDLDKKIKENSEARIQYIDIDEAYILLNLPYHKKAIELLKEELNKK